MVEWDNLDQFLAAAAPQRAVKELVGLFALHPYVLTGKIHCLVVLYCQVIVVDLIYGERQLERVALVTIGVHALKGVLLGLVYVSHLLVDYGLQPFRGGLYGPFVDVAPYPTTVQLLRYGGGGA